MIIKLTDKQYSFLKKYLATEKPDLYKVFENYSAGMHEINDDIGNEIREWASDKLQVGGFNNSYETNDNGKILEDLIDIFYL